MGTWDKEPVPLSLTYFLTVLRYIHQNPLKAGIARNIYENKWTSINEYICDPSLVDVDFALKLFSSDRKTAQKLLIQYMEQSNDDKCLDNEQSFKKITDDEVREYLFHLEIKNSSSLQRMEKAQRDTIILKLKDLNGVSTRQISRVTGISKSTVDRVI